MPKKKKQHYVPKALLKRFSVDKKCYVYNLKTNEVSNNPFPYDNQCYTDYMYGKDVSIENQLGIIESDFARVLDSVVLNNQLPADREKLKILSQYIILQWLRTEKSIDRFQSSAKRAIQSITPDVLSYHKAKSNDYAVEKFGEEYVRTHFPRQEIAINNIEVAQSEDLDVSDLTLCILNNATDLGLVVSDDLVVIGNDYQPVYGLGAKCAGVYFFMPISPKLMLLLYDDKMYKKEKNELTLAEVRFLNALQFNNSRNIILSKDRNSLEKLKKEYDDLVFNNVFKFFQFIGWKDPFRINYEIPHFINTYVKEYSYLRMNLPVGINNVIKINNVFTPYQGKPEMFFTRCNRDEYFLKTQYWGADFSKLVYDIYLSK